MYEAEVNDRVEMPEAIPSGILAQFAEYRPRIEARTLMPWGEHCTECAWPSCYSTCDLYEPRADGACRQFVDGVVRIPTPHGTTPYVQKITFRRWAKLWTLGNLQHHTQEGAEFAERVNIAVGAAARHAPLPIFVKQRVLRKVAYIRKQQLAERPAEGGWTPDYLVCEVFNPNGQPVSLTLSIRERAETQRRSFQRLITVAPGFRREKIAVSDINGVIATTGVFEVELVPNEAEGLTLYFGLLDFVKERAAVRAPVPAAPAPAATVKCVVWDLDHTLWNGILVEDGPAAIRLHEGVRDVIEELDRRGILQSIASKNNHDEVRAVLETLGIAEYFLRPQIHWRPKSASVAAIAEALNIGIDTLMFVDDQPFERQEVSSAWPQVRVVDARDLQGIVGLACTQVTITEESRTRRLMYRQEEQRTALQSVYEGNYLTFLKESNIRVEWAPLSESNLTRVYELAQRTNQMNFSGNRYSLDQLRSLMNDEAMETYVLRCSDRFGVYGIVGFSVVELRDARLLDLMFSCRVQSKRVEHAFLAWLLRRHLQSETGRFLANLRKTAKNAPSAAVFGEMGFEEGDTTNGVTTLRYPGDRPVSDDGIITIEAAPAS
jgi:FkbH-like protein